jgi:hypothetical protein
MEKYRLPGQSCVRRSRYGAQCRVRCVVARHSPSEPNGFKTEFVQFLRDRLSIMSSLLAISRYLSYIRLAFSFLSHMTPRLWQDWIAMPVCPSFRREGGGNSRPVWVRLVSFLGWSPFLGTFGSRRGPLNGDHPDNG